MTADGWYDFLKTKNPDAPVYVGEHCGSVYVGIEKVTHCSTCGATLVCEPYEAQVR